MMWLPIEVMSPNKYEDKEVASVDDFLMAELDDEVPFWAVWKTFDN